MKTVLIPLAPGFEDLEAVTLIDLLRRAGIEVVTAGLHAGLIQGARGVRVQPDALLDEVMARDFDMIALPGGMPGAEHLKNDARVQAVLRRLGGAGKYTAAICAAPIALAAAGLLEGRRATSYPGFIEKLGLANTTCVEDAVVVDGKVATSRGPGTAMDFALTLIELLLGRDQRDQVEAGLVRA
ncbi:MAG: DJ-1/PfpI family protein [Pseudomonadota bacterium]|nr:DJ-1/PfpI family protein [Pseudomonadota bacterium]MDP1903358.1 DJ-1/PfpI family protein [Pseudomonadota bacterium]MDP2352328.1 DJ-1/PfpI family protein [Pseudomonadota bacterium]